MNSKYVLMLPTEIPNLRQISSALFASKYPVPNLVVIPVHVAVVIPHLICLAENFIY